MTDEIRTKWEKFSNDLCSESFTENLIKTDGWKTALREAMIDIQVLLDIIAKKEKK